MLKWIRWAGGMVAACGHGPMAVLFAVLICVVVLVAIMVVLAAVFADRPGRRTRALLRAWGDARRRP